MIKRKASLEAKEISKMRDGKGTVYATGLMELAEFHGAGRIFSHMRVPAGCSIGLHPHMEEFETYYIIKGTAKYLDDGVEVILTAGDVAYNPMGEAHAIENIGEDDLEFIAYIGIPVQ